MQTTLPFGRFVMEHEAFRSGQFDTGFVGRYFTPDKLDTAPDTAEAELAAVLAAYLFQQQRPRPSGTLTQVRPTSNWKKNRL